MMAFPQFIITAPHACPAAGRVQDPGCDRDAAFYARIIYETLQTQRPPDTVEPELIIPALPDRDRATIDPNRRRGWDHPMRQDLRQFLIRHARGVYVIDVHSYEPSTDRWADGRRWGRWPLIALDDDREPTAYAMDLIEELSERDIPVPIQPGAHNDIMDEVRARGGKAILLEFNEATRKTSSETAKNLGREVGMALLTAAAAHVFIPSPAL